MGFRKASVSSLSSHASSLTLVAPARAFNPHDSLLTPGSASKRRTFEYHFDGNSFRPHSFTKIKGILEPNLGFWSGTALVVSGIVGAGIFATPSVITKEVGSVGASLLLWIIGGLASIAGGCSYIEWGTMFPDKSGGDQYYLYKAFPRPKALAAFLFAWCNIYLVRPAFAAAMSTVCAKYIMFGIWGHHSSLSADSPILENWNLINKVLAVCILTAMTFINGFSVRLAIRMQDFLTLIKVVVLAVFSCAGLVVLFGGMPSIPKTDNFTNMFAGTTTDPGNIASALFKVFYVFDGFNYLSYSASELKNPTVNLPRCTIVGVTLTTILYFLINIGFLAVVPLKEFIGAGEVLGAVFAEKVFGTLVGQRIVPFLIASCAFSAGSAVVFGSGRITLAACERRLVPNILSRYVGSISRYNTPLNALLFNHVIAFIMIIGPPGQKAFAFLVDLATYPSWIFYGMSLIGLLYYRKLDRFIPRPFRVWTFAPVLVILVSIFLAIVPFTSTESYLSATIACVVIGLGIAVYSVWTKYFGAKFVEDYFYPF